MQAKIFIGFNLMFFLLLMITGCTHHTNPIIMPSTTTTQTERPINYQPQNTSPVMIPSTTTTQTEQPINYQPQNMSHYSTVEIQKLVNEHNRVRANVGVAPISWSNEVAAVAQNWANQLKNRGCQMQHSRASGYGENLFMSWGRFYGVEQAVKSWESEQKYYHGQALNSSNWYDAGHYTQIVWSKTKRIGCGNAICGNKQVVVCNYDPPGNFIGQKPY